MGLKRAYEFYYYLFPHTVLTKGESITLHFIFLSIMFLVYSTLRFSIGKLYLVTYSLLSQDIMV